MKISIRSKLITYFLIAIIGSMSLCSVLVSMRVTNMLDENMKLSSQQTVSESLGEFQTYLKTLSIPVDLMTRKREVKYIGKEGDYKDYVKSIQDSLVASMKVVQKPVRAFYALSEKNVINTYLYFDEEEGKIKSKKELFENVDYTQEDWFVSAIKSPSKSEHAIFSVFTKPYYDEEFDVNIITVSQEIRMDDATVGVVALDIESSTLENYVQNIPLLNTGYVLLVDADGNIIVDNEKNTTGITSFAELNCWSTYQQDNLLMAEAVAKAEEVGEELDVSTYIKTYTEQINGQSYYITVLEDEITGWKLVGMIRGDLENASNLNELFVAILIGAVVGLIIGIIVAFVVAVSLSKEIRRVQEATSKLAEGNFSEHILVKRKDEIGELQENFNSMVDSVAGLIKEVDTKFEDVYTMASDIGDVSKTTKETANQVSMAIQSVAVGATEQSQSTQDANEIVEKLADSLEETKEYVNNVNQMSKAANELSLQGMDVVGELIEKTDKNRENAKASGEMINEMLESITKINYMSDAIADITNQTNLLSLNASIEAARAGELGKGFAVVADEIRKLAEQSRQSTDEIKAIIEEISGKSELVVKNLAESDKLQNEQGKAIDDTRELFNRISTSVNNLMNGMEKIGALNENMAANKNTVLNSMENIANISEQSAAASEEVTASAEMVNVTMEDVASYAQQLNVIAMDLKTTISKFKL
ncbi:MAG: methyl-accepting chemotaxis protein [Lachnospiraceae bacterium]|nr:methyl-accepting chemotaxis protein [Lachnospiraceae bacterium]